MSWASSPASHGPGGSHIARSPYSTGGEDLTPAPEDSSESGSSARSSCGPRFRGHGLRFRVMLRPYDCVVPTALTHAGKERPSRRASAVTAARSLRRLSALAEDGGGGDFNLDEAYRRVNTHRLA